jgi:carboxyl-terminal processing protease
MKYARRVSIALALVGTFVLGGFILPDPAAQAGPRLFQEVFTLVSRAYVDSLDVSGLYEKAARGLLEQIEDPYAALFSPEEMEQFTVAYEGHYGGVGMMVENQNGAAVVSRVFPNTPAERAGILVGDRIVAVGEESTDGWPLEKVTGKLKGEPGTTVAVQFRRPGAESPYTAELERAIIRIPAVPYATTLDGDIGYIPLLQFNETAAEEVAAAVRRLVDDGVRGLVLDLRGNGGGIVSEAVEISGLFLPPGTKVAEQRERGGRVQTYVTTSRPIAPDLPLVVLIDGGTASASEIVAGALQDHDRAVVIGTTSFGKGLVQSAFRLDEGYVLKMTTGKWFTPSGRTIHKERVLVDGRLVEAPDSAAADTSRAGRPTFRSDAGRVVYGGGGIMPDLIVRPDTLSEPEQAFVKAILPKSQDVHLTLFDYAYELKSKVDRDFKVRPEWREELYRRLTERGVQVDRALYDGAASYVDRLLENRVARMAFGDEGALHHGLDDDAQLRRALDLLRQGRTQKDLFARVAQAGDEG